MIRQKSKIFLLITALITFVMLVSFGVLYFLLPDFYLYTKNKKLQSQSETLAESLKQVSSYEACSDLIRDFSLENNSNVIPYDQSGSIIPSLFSPLMMLSVRLSDELHLTTIQTQRQETIQIHDGSSDNFRFFITDKTRQVLPSHNAGNANPSTRSVHLAGAAGKAALIRVDVQNDIISYIEVTSTFQPIDEAKNVLLSLMPFLLIADILIALAAAYLYLKKVDQYERDKVGFMRAASHELKTPVAALGGILEGMIDQVGAYKDTDKYLKESKELVDRLGKLINEILNASQNEKLVLEKVDVSKMIDDVLSSYKLFIEEKGLEISIETVPASGSHYPDFTCRADKRLFFMILSNLISNAVHYTKPGGLIHVKIVEQQTLSIENECDPIGEEHLTRLYEPFYTLNASRDKSQSGTGLGLYIVRRGLDAMKMHYQLENTNSGIRFSIFF